MTEQALFFTYGEREINYLKSKDACLAKVIDRIGYVERKIDTDLFSSVIHHIIGQQVSTKAHHTVWQRMSDYLGTVTPVEIDKVSVQELQSFGMTYKKAEYIKSFSEKVTSGEFALDSVKQMTDGEAIAALTSLKGIGVWTAQMILLHCLQRPDIISYDDLAIRRGMEAVYHKEIDTEFFETCRKRLSPYGSVASLYFWAVSKEQQ